MTRARGGVRRRRSGGRGTLGPGDTIPSRRALFGLLAAIALLALPALAIGPADEHDGRASETIVETPAAAANMVHPATSPSARQLPRVAVSSAGAMIAASLLGSLTLLSRLLGRRGRRVGDVGDSWRSLLLGAPPSVA